MSGIVGTLTFFADSGAGEQELARLLSCRLNVGTQILEALEPRFITELQEWSAAATHLDVYDADTDSRPSAVIALELASFEGTKITVRFAAPGGREYDGQVFIEKFSLTGTDGGRVTGDFAVRGAGALTPSTGE